MDNEDAVSGLLTKKNDFNILKSAYLFSKYAGAGKTLRKLQDLKQIMEGKTASQEGGEGTGTDPFFKLRSSWISY